MSFNAPAEPGAFIPTTDIFQADDPKQMLIQLRQAFNDVANVLNIKDSGFYVETEFVNGQLWFKPTVPLVGKEPNFRQVFRKVIDCGALPNAGVKNVAHGITTNQNFSFTRIYGVSTDPAAATVNSAIPLPYINVAAPADSVQLSVTATNVVLTTTTANYVNYITTYVVLEYIKE